MKKFKNNVGADASTAYNYCNKIEDFDNNLSVRPTSKAKQNKGITLIALVITIIVMLILVAVTISMAVNGGLFGYAGKAAEETENVINEEQQLASGRVQIGGVWYESIDQYVTGNLHNWTRSEDSFICSHCNAGYTMGEVVNYTATGTSTMYGHKLGLTESAEVEGNEMAISGQDTEWIVLGIEDTNKDGVIETLLITSEAPVALQSDDIIADLPLNGAAAYNYAIDEINRICKDLYSNSEYGEARGMTIEDVNNALNYKPIGGIYDGDSGYQYTEGLTTKLRKVEEVYNTIINKGNYQTPDGTNTSKALGDYEINGYWYFVNGEDSLILENEVNDLKSTITEIERSTIFGLWSEDWGCYEYRYWLASRGVYASSDCAGFGLGFVAEGYANSCSDLFDSRGVEFNNGNSLRPVVSLKSKLPTVK